jgi:hypothetical protein
LLSLFFLAAFSELAIAKGTEVRFQGTITRIDRISAVSGTVTLRLMTLEVPVKVNSDTEIEAGDEIGLAGLQVGDFVKVHGHFSSAGITAEEIDVLDEFVNTFRLRGLISSGRVTPLGSPAITLLGVEVLIDLNTKIEARGSSAPFPVSSLAVGMFVDVRGTFQNNALLATRIKVGVRDDDAIGVEFEGKITSLSAGRLLVDTKAGGNAAVLFNSSTEIKGTLAVGKFVEVEGILNSNLEVVAKEIKVDGDDDGDADDDDDDDDKDDDEFEKQISLVATSPGSSITGRAKIELESEHGTTKQEFEVDIEKAAPNTTLRIRVQIAGAGVFDFGQFVTDGDGKAKVRFRSDPSGSDRALVPLLPSGKKVVDFQTVEITNNNLVVLTGQF